MLKDVLALDKYKDVRLLIVVGRAIPGPEKAEAVAGALSGCEPEHLPHYIGERFPTWFLRRVVGLAMRVGPSIGTEADFHPDSLVEDVRWQHNEAKVIQAIGRARGINRDASTPLIPRIRGKILGPSQGG